MAEFDTLTALGDVPGTLAYISPERLPASRRRAAADVWAVGVLLWEALAGEHPFWEGDLAETSRTDPARARRRSIRVRPDLPRHVLDDRRRRARRRTRRAGRRPAGSRQSCARSARSGAASRRAAPRRARQATGCALGRGARAAGGARRRGDRLDRLDAALLPAAARRSALAALAARSASAAPRAGLAFALAAGFFPLANISLGLAIVYGVLAVCWLALSWRDARAGLLLVAGPLLAPLAALGLFPLAAQFARGRVRRAVQAGAAVLLARSSPGFGMHVSPSTRRYRRSGSGSPAATADRRRVRALARSSPRTRRCCRGGGLRGRGGRCPGVRRRGPWPAAAFAAAYCSQPPRWSLRPRPCFRSIGGRLADRGRSGCSKRSRRLTAGKSRPGLPMTVLRSIESKLESLFEGVFGRAFRTNVQPVELARKLVKEMDDHRNVSVSRVYVPNEYTVYLSPGDREQFASYEDALSDELSDYLAEHARRENYALLTPPQVLARDRRRPRGRRVRDRDAARRSAAGRSGAPAAAPEPGATMIYKAPPPGAAADGGRRAGRARCRARGRRRSRCGRRAARDRRGTRVVLGRSKDCDIQVADPNVSRRHAEVRREGATYWLVDLDSTNGIEVDGKRVKQLKLEDGTRFTIGSTEIVVRAGDSRDVLAARPRSRPPCSSSRSRSSSCSTSSSGGSSAPPRATCALPQESMILSPQQASAPARRSRPRASSAAWSCVTSPALERGRRVRARLRAAHRRAAAATTTSRSPATSTPRRATRASSRAATASRSRTSARRTARS